MRISKDYINIEIAAARSTPRTRKREVLLRAKKILGDKAETWLNSPLPALGGQIPAVMTETIEGSELIHDKLVRIEHGVFI